MITPGARGAVVEAESPQRAPVEQARLLEVGQVDRVVDVAERIAIAEPDFDAVGEHVGHARVVSDAAVPISRVQSAVPVPAETFTDDERARLAPYFTNLDGHVFALTNLPETVKGALFARYSRSAKSLRRLFLDEFADKDVAGGRAGRRRGRRSAARAPRSSTHGSSTSTATTRSRSSAARTSPASTSRTS